MGRNPEERPPSPPGLSTRNTHFLIEDVHAAFTRISARAPSPSDTVGAKAIKHRTREEPP
jgi:hypothetical protein